MNFVGNVEGRDLYNGKIDVIVADGFVGNVALKISEGVANLVRTALKESLKATITGQVGALLSRSAFTDFKKRLDHTEYGGAPLLGVKGVCIITHGSSNANAIKNAVRVAAEFSERGHQRVDRARTGGVASAPRLKKLATIQLSLPCITMQQSNHRIALPRPGLASRRHGQRSRRKISRRAADLRRSRRGARLQAVASFASKARKTSFA